MVRITKQKYACRDAEECFRATFVLVTVKLFALLCGGVSARIKCDCIAPCTCGGHGSGTICPICGDLRENGPHGRVARVS